MHSALIRHKELQKRGWNWKPAPNSFKKLTIFTFQEQPLSCAKATANFYPYLGQCYLKTFCGHLGKTKRCNKRFKNREIAWGSMSNSKSQSQILRNAALSERASVWSRPATFKVCPLFRTHSAHQIHLKFQFHINNLFILKFGLYIINLYVSNKSLPNMIITEV